MSAKKTTNINELKKVYEKIELMRKLATRKGFFEYYFSKINNADTNEKVFYLVNEEYRKLFGKPKFKSYDSFRHSLARYLKK